MSLLRFVDGYKPAPPPAPAPPPFLTLLNHRGKAYVKSASRQLIEIAHKALPMSSIEEKNDMYIIDSDQDFYRSSRPNPRYTIF